MMDENNTHLKPHTSESVNVIIQAERRGDEKYPIMLNDKTEKEDEKARSEIGTLSNMTPVADGNTQPPKKSVNHNATTHGKTV